MKRLLRQIRLYIGQELIWSGFRLMSDDLDDDALKGFQAFLETLRRQG